MQTYQTVYIKYVQVFVYKLYPNKIEKKYGNTCESTLKTETNFTYLRNHSHY